MMILRSRGLIKLLLALFLWVSQNKTIVFIPTSAAIDISRRVVEDEGFSLSDKERYFFDVMLDKDQKPVYPGYITVGFYWNSSPANTISINEKTGQILDMDRCFLFEYPSVQKFSRDIRQENGERALSINELKETTGCGETLEILRKPKPTKAKPRKQHVVQISLVPSIQNPTHAHFSAQGHLCPEERCDTASSCRAALCS
jgi:hypothetical protein